MTATNRPSRTSFWLLGLVWFITLLAGVAMLVVGLLRPNNAQPEDLQNALLKWGQMMTLTSSLFYCMLALAVALTSLSIVKHLIGLRDGTASMVEDLRRMLSGQTQNQSLLGQINQNLLLNDAIKAVAFREKARDVLQEAIRQDIRKEQWGSAGVLIEELAKRFGATTEAEQLRDELESYRKAGIEEKIDKSIEHIQSLWIIHRYDEAQNEYEALGKLYPNSQKVLALHGQTVKHQENHKKELLARWDKAVENNDVDQGVELLKLLDKYLSPTEAAALEESARGVFRAKLHSLGVKFSLFVTEKRWRQALLVGREIIKDFPNSRMAQEVRDRLSILEQRVQE